MKKIFLNIKIEDFLKYKDRRSLIFSEYEPSEKDLSKLVNCQRLSVSNSILGYNLEKIPLKDLNVMDMDYSYLEDMRFNNLYINILNKEDINHMNCDSLILRDDISLKGDIRINNIALSFMNA